MAREEFVSTAAGEVAGCSELVESMELDVGHAAPELGRLGRGEQDVHYSSSSTLAPYAGHGQSRPGSERMDCWYAKCSQFRPGSSDASLMKVAMSQDVDPAHSPSSCKLEKVGFKNGSM